MAYPTRGREPLLDTGTQAFLERRLREISGLFLIATTIFMALMIASYSTLDAITLARGSGGIENLTGALGANIAQYILKVFGYGSWGFPIIFMAWGLRFVSHKGAERFLARAFYAPIFWVFCAIYAATLTPSAQWSHNFSMGGLFGDTILMLILQITPGAAGLSANIISAFFGALAAITGMFVAGLTFFELRLGLSWAGRWTLLGLQGIFYLLSKPFRRADAENSEQHSHYDDVVMEEAAEKPVSKSLFARIPRVLKTQSAEENVMRAEPPQMAPQSESQKRIDEKILNAIANKGDAPVVAPHANGPAPMILRGAVPEDKTDTVVDFAQYQEPEAPVQDADDSYDLLSGEYDLPADPPLMPAPAQPRSVVQMPQRKAPTPSKQAAQEAQPKLQFETAAKADYELPPLSMLMSPVKIERHVLSNEALEENARMLENVLDDYGVKGEILSVRPGPVVTMYELEPAPGLKASRVIGLADDIARSMSALAARVSTVPGRSVIGIELPNENREMVALREILSTRDFGDSTMQLPLALGKDIGGESIVANLAKMPHLLIAGTTGSGKSVAINTMILSLLYRLTPEECRMIMIDPKMLELSVYDGIPHLLSPVVTDPKKAVVALKWVVGEMEERYRKMSKMGVRNIDGYNGRVADAVAKDEMFSRTVQTGFDDETGEPIFETEEFAPEKLPYIVVVVDEMADLMMVAGKEIEACIQRLAQMARASGIHLIMATQRPSVDVITGTIKANFPTRISFQVTSKVDSRTILGEMGAEQLLGMGDMLYMAGGGKITRVHGPFCSDEEVEEVVNHLKSYGPPSYLSGVLEGPADDRESDIDAVLGLGGNSDSEDAMYDTAVQIVSKDRKCSTSYIQRKLAIGYNKAARLVEQMEDNGVVSPANHVGKREVFVPER